MWRCLNVYAEVIWVDGLYVGMIRIGAEGREGGDDRGKRRKSNEAGRKAKHNNSRASKVEEGDVGVVSQRSLFVLSFLHLLCLNKMAHHNPRAGPD